MQGINGEYMGHGQYSLFGGLSRILLKGLLGCMQGVLTRGHMGD